MSVLSPAAKRVRQQLILEIVGRYPVHSQEELVEMLAARGFPVTQATVSRDISELGLVKAPRPDGHMYVAPAALGREATATDTRLERVLASSEITIGRSGLTLVLRGPRGSAQALAQAIDESSLREQEGTLAGDDTVLVLFADEDRLERWRTRFRRLQGLPPD
ncbi:MAG: arginine repressor [Chloroflexi bacterium]|nr:arginine repressor [Chloroflexota bacterium]